MAQLRGWGKAALGGVAEPEHQVLTIVDRVAGALFCLTWLALNIRAWILVLGDRIDLHRTGRMLLQSSEAIWHVRRNSSKAEPCCLSRMPGTLAQISWRVQAESLGLGRLPRSLSGQRHEISFDLPCRVRFD